MAEVWEPDYTHRGHWSVPTLGSGSWQDGDFRTDPGSGFANSRYGYIRWPGPDVPVDNIVAATLSATRTAGSGNAELSVYRGAAPAPTNSNRPGSASLSHLVSTSGSTGQWDITADLLTALSESGWSPGDAIAIYGAPGGAGTFDIALTIEWQEPLQELDPATVHVPVVVGGPVDATFAVTPVTVHVPARVGRVDVIAPRSLTVADTLRAPATTGQAAISGTGSAPPLDMADTLHVPVSVGVALLSLTIPPPEPPIPWQRLITDPAYRAALNSREPVTDARVEIINPDGAVIATLGGQDATHPGVVGGTVTCSGTAAIRWTCDLTIDNPDLVPESHHDLLHPLAHNAVRIWWRIRLPDGTWGEIPVGTYHLDWPTVTDVGDATIGLTAQGSDPVAEVKRARYRDPIDVGGMTADIAVRTILQDRAPWATLSITPSDYRLPQDYEAGEPGGDPIEDITKIAESAGMIFYADRMGTLTLTDQPDPGTPVEEFIEGPGCAMTEISASVNLDDLLNSVTVASTVTQDEDGNDIEPITAHVEDDDPTSPLWIGRGRIRHRRIEHDYVETQQQAENVARRTLDQHRAAVDQVELVAFARPHLDPWDVITVSADRARVTGARQVQSWSLALGDLSGQRVTTVGRRGLT